MKSPRTRTTVVEEGKGSQREIRICSDASCVLSEKDVWSSKAIEVTECIEEPDSEACKGCKITWCTHHKEH